MRKLPSTQALACFESAARHESYTRAAQELALTQSAVSRQVQALEAQLGIALFRRVRHGVVLTPAGRQYARQIAGRLAGIERDTLDAMAQHGTGGAVALAAVPTFATRWLIPRLPRLAAQHPDLVVHIETRTRPFLFADSGFDAALYAGTAEQVAQWPGTQALHLLDEEVLPVCKPALLPRGAATSPARIAQLPLLQQSTRPDGWRRWFASAGLDVPAAAAGPRYELFSMLAEAAVHGLGVALVPPMLVADELARGTLAIACAHRLQGERAYHLVLPAGAAAEPLTRFVDWLRAEAAAA